MKRLKNFFLAVVFAVASGLATAQSTSYPEGQVQRDLPFSFLQYVQENEIEDIDYKLLKGKYLVPKDLDSASSKTYGFMLSHLKTQLQGMELEKYAVMPWPQYPFPEKLPSLVDQTTPITDIMGVPVEQQKKPSPEERAKLREAILVGYEKEHPGYPAFYILLTPEKDRILSWMLIKQGKYHYFLTY